MKVTFYIALVAVFFLASCGGQNYLTEMSNQSSDDAIYAEVLKLVDDRKYDEALVELARMSASARSDQKVVRTEAGVYAGKCGLDFLEFFSNIGNSGSLFSIFMGGFRGTAVNVAACQLAQDKLEAKFGVTSALRVANWDDSISDDVNLFMAILGMAKIGAQLRDAADRDGTGGLGNGTVDGTFNSCNAGSLSNAGVINVGTGFGLLFDNLTAIADKLSGANGSLLNGISTTCSNPMLGTNPCLITSVTATAWGNATTLKAIRSLVKSQDFGIESCASGNPIYPFNCCP